MSIQTIWSGLRSAGLTPAGAAGLMGNMSAESAMRANKAQNGMTDLSDGDYTAGVDNGTYARFVSDAVGYGLCQWTYHTRKAALLAYAKESGASIGDEAMQVQFCLKELRRDFPALWTYLCAAEDCGAAAERVCREYERPAVNNIEARASAAQGYFKMLSGSNSIAEKARSAGASEAKSWAADMSALCEGACGTQVAALSKLLAVCGYENAPTQSKFGAELRAAVTAFQRAKGLTCDGIAGPKTWAALLGG